MKNNMLQLYPWAIAICLGCFGCLNATGADLIGRYATITLDGSLSDWQSSDTLYQSSEIGVGAPLNTTFTNVFVANDSDYLYVGLLTPATSAITDPQTYNLYLDTDMNGGTGFNSGWMSGGYDHLVEYGNSGSTYSVYDFTGADQSTWSWNWDSVINYAYSDTLVEWAIPLNMLGANLSQIRMEFNVTGAGVTTETWASQYESGASTYTPATAPAPEPSTMGLFGLGILTLIVIAIQRQRNQNKFSLKISHRY